MHFKFFHRSLRSKEFQLDAKELRKTIDDLNFEGLDLANLVAFKESVELKLKQHEAEEHYRALQYGLNFSLSTWKRILPRRVVLARDLTGEDLVAYFGLKNTIDATGEVTYPPFLAAETGGSCGEWLAHALNLGADIFRGKRADIKVIIDLIVMDVIQHLPRFQVLEHFTPGETDPPLPPAVYTGDTPLPPKRMKIRTYKEGALCMTVGTGRDQTRIVGSYNAAFTCSYQMPAQGRFCAPFLATHLLVLRVKKGPLRYFLAKAIETGTNELTACLAMNYLAQEGRYAGGPFRRGHFTRDLGYGIVSDGNWCRFVFLDSQMKAHRSPVLMIKYDIMEILRYFRLIFDAIVVDYHPPPP